MVCQPLTEEQRFLTQYFHRTEALDTWPNYADFTEDTIAAICDEAAKFAQDKLQPLNRSGDSEHAKLVNGQVTTPKGFKEAYHEFVANGWNAAPFPIEHGGMGLPHLVHTAISEHYNRTNMAFALCPMLTQSAIELLMHHGSESQKSYYLPHLVAGTWTATMCLTEPQAGSDVGALTTKATKHSDHYLIKGQKIFITYGDHDFTDNIIHMVLARTENAPAGSKGISLFIVPKILEDGTHNDVSVVSLEHKLGIHASPTALMSFGDTNTCRGYLVGEENHGLVYMFTMMNQARLAVALQGVAIAEDAYQKSYHYANERIQGKSINDGTSATIIKHPDIDYNLTSIRTRISIIRAITYYTALCIDGANHHPDIDASKRYAEHVLLMTPIAKAYATDQGFLLCSEALQIFGGMGYIEETGIAQNLRDARIPMIYEGTNGIQALDLLLRKIMPDNGTAFCSMIDTLLTRITQTEQLQEEHTALIALCERLKETCLTLCSITKTSKRKGSYVATSFLTLCGMVLGYYFTFSLATNPGDDCSDELKTQKMQNLKFYYRFLLPQAEALATTICR